MAKQFNDETFVRPAHELNLESNLESGQKGSDKPKTKQRGLLKKVIVIVLVVLTLAFAGLSIFLNHEYTTQTAKIDSLKLEIAELQLYKYEVLNEYQDIVIIMDSTCHRPGCPAISVMPGAYVHEFMYLDEATAAGYRECSTCLGNNSMKDYLVEKYEF